MAAAVRRVAPALAALVLAGAAPGRAERSAPEDAAPRIGAAPGRAERSAPGSHASEERAPADAGDAGKDLLTFASSASRATLLELFTSEGCSSCPPAEEWLSGLRSDPRLWKEVIPVAFHVDYWDHIGWKDPLADARFTARQRDYARTWDGGGMYTPGFVLDGREWKEWFSAPELPALVGGAVGTLTARASGGRRFEVGYVPVADEGAWEAHAALLGMGIAIDVKAGENRGRRLRHDFAVLSYSVFALKGDGGRHAAAFELPEPSRKAPSYALAVWVTRSGGPPVQAAGGFLPADSFRWMK